MFGCHPRTWRVRDALRRLLGLASTNGTREEDSSSAAFDTSVQGYASDRQPDAGGASLMTLVIGPLQSADIHCCIAGTAALVYYGAHRTMTDWTLCVEDEKVAAAAAILRDHVDAVEPFQQSSMKPDDTVDHHFPRFKFKGFRCFLHVVPAWTHRVTCEPESLEYSKLGLPFPKLEGLAQSLLETMSRVDLQDLVDGMNLDYEWGIQALDLQGQTDLEWAARKLDYHEQTGEWSPVWLRREGADKLLLWSDVASVESRAKRRGHKALPKDETRFRLKGQKDPRELHLW